eukprot:1298539-Pleurochrysis_carterae.AAC.1
MHTANQTLKLRIEAARAGKDPAEDPTKKREHKTKDHKKRDDASETGRKKLVIPTNLKGYGEVKFRKEAFFCTCNQNRSNQRSQVFAGQARAPAVRHAAPWRSNSRRDG